MTTHAMRGTHPEVDTEESRGLVFAAVVLGVIAFFNLLNGIAAIANSHVFVSNANYVIGDLRAWGWVVTILGGIQLVAAFGVAMKNQAARWFAVAVVSLNALAQMFFVPAYPFWALMIIAMDIVALYALCVFGSREGWR